MTSENTTVEKKPKNPKRVAAGKKGVEARKLKAELKRKEEEAMKKENIKLRTISESPIQITKDDRVSEMNGSLNEVKESRGKEVQYKNYIPLCLIGVVGLGFYLYSKPKQQTVEPAQQHAAQTVAPKKEIDPFEFN